MIPDIAMERIKLGIALGSGGARGLSHIPVLQMLERNSIRADYVAGSSMGAVIGAVYCAGKLDDFERIALRYHKDDKIYSLAGFAASPSGISDIEPFMKILRRILFPYAKLEDLPIPLAVVCTEYYSGKPVAFTKGDIITAIRASLSIPGALVPVKYGDTFLIDGGVSNAVPVDAARAMGADKVIAVNINPLDRLKIKSSVIDQSDPFPRTSLSSLEKKYYPTVAASSKKITFSAVKKSIPVLFQVIKKTLGLIKYTYKYIFRNKSKDITKKHIFFPKKKEGLPNIVEILWQTIDIMQMINTAAVFEKYKPEVIIEPDVIGIFPFDFSMIPEAISAGREAAEEKKDEIIAILRDHSSETL